MSVSQSSDKELIGLRIRAKRIAAGFNRSELSRKVEVTPQAVQQWEEGITSPRGKNLRKLADFLNTSPQYIQYGDERSQIEENRGYYNLPGFVGETSFAEIYKESIEQMIRLSCEFGWIELKSGVEVSMVSDIGLSFIKNHERMLPAESRFNTKDKAKALKKDDQLALDQPNDNPPDGLIE